jgi:hypothetical protein
MKKLISVAAIVLTLAGCASVAKVDSGDRPIGDRLVVTLDGPWNQFNAPNPGPAQIWTMEGVPVDQLLLYSGIKNGQAIHAERAGPAGADKPKVFAFRSNMQPDEVVALFEGMLTRDGSRFELVKLEPAAFGGGKGFRFDYALTRKVDNVQLRGFGYGMVSKGELFAIVYMAPKIAFFARHAPKVEQMCRSARVKDA